MKFIPFEHSNQVVNTNDPHAPMHYLNDGNGGIILCAEIDKEDLKFIRNQGRIYILLHGFSVPPPIAAVAFDPFKPLNNSSNDTPKNETSNEASDDQQHNAGDNKLHISGR